MIDPQHNTAIVVVIVLYGETAEESKTFRAISSQLSVKDVVFIVDNSQQKGSEPIVDKAQLMYFHTGENLGVSGAYNVAFKWCKENGYSNVLLCDQDTGFPANSVEKYRASHPTESKIVAPIVYSANKMISPFSFFYKYLPGYHKGIESGTYALKGLGLINSGMYLSIETICKYGLYNENIALDWSDMEYCHRLGEQGVQVELLDLKIDQNLSLDEARTMSKVRWFYYLKGALYFAGKPLLPRFLLTYGTGKVALKYTLMTGRLFWFKTWFSHFFFKVISGEASKDTVKYL